MQLFSADATIFFFFFFDFAHKKLKKSPWKVVQKNSNPLLFLQIAQMAQTEEFMLQNVAYRPTVYRTGVVDFRVLSIPPLSNDIFCSQSWIMDI